MDDMEMIIKAYEVMSLEVEIDETTKSQFIKEMGEELTQVRRILEEGGLHSSKVIEELITTFIQTFSREDVPYVFFVEHTHQLVNIITLIKRYATTYKSFRRLWKKYHDEISRIVSNIPFEENERYNLLSISKL